MDEKQGNLRGMAWGAAASLLTAGWWVMTRQAATDAVSPMDMAALRFAVSGILLAPVVWRRRHDFLRVPRWLLALMVVCGGLPYSLVVATGLRGATAGAGGAVVAGLLPLFGAILSGIVFRERISSRRCLGLGLIIVATIAFTGVAGSLAANALLAAAALMAAGFSVALRSSGLAPLTAIALVCVTSAVGFVPVHLIAAPGALADAIVTAWPHALYQGIVSAIVAVYCFARAVHLLGASRASLFAALVPVVTTILGACLLSEQPTPGNCAFVLSVVCGAALASGAIRLPNPIVELINVHKTHRGISSLD